MSEPNVPFQQPKKRVRDVLDDALLIAIQELPPEEKKRIGRELFEEKRRQLSYRERMKDSLTWFFAGAPVWLPLGVVIAWYFFAWIPFALQLGLI